MQRESEWNAVKFYIILLYNVIKCYYSSIGEVQIKEVYGKFGNPLVFK